MEAVDAMDAQQEVLDRPQIDSWRREPTRAQVRYATDLCRSELPYAERVRTLGAFPALDSQAISELIARLAEMREQRMRRLRRSRRSRRR